MTTVTPETMRSVLGRRGKYYAGDMAFAAVTVACILAGLGLLFLSPTKINGPALATIYAIAPPKILGFVWLAVSVLPFWALINPSCESRERVYWVMLPLGTGWTAGLAVPLVAHETSNFWAPLIWGLFTVMGFITYWLVPLDSGFYSPLDEKLTSPRHLER